jgi:hypothetical protein
VRDDLVPIEIEVDPMLGAAALGASEQLAIEAARGREIVNRKGEVKGRQGHRAARLNRFRTRRN